MGQTTNKVRARERRPYERNKMAVAMPIEAGREFELFIRNPRGIQQLDISSHGRYVAVTAVEPIEKWTVGIVPLYFRNAVWLVRVCETGECVLLKKRAA